MKKKTYSLFFTLFIALVAMGSSNESRITEYWSTPAGLKVPESVIYDQANQLLYVSNINGKPTEKNNQGFISRVRIDGRIETLSWISGIHAPKGMGIDSGRLYVTDIDRIHVIDISRGKIIKTHEVPKAQFLNDIAIDEKGKVYITDMMTKKIHRLKDNHIDTWLNLAEYSNPNGLILENNILFVGTDKGLLRISLADKTIQMEIPVSGGIDGLKRIKEGTYVVSDWKGKTQLISKSNPPVVLLDTTNEKINSADLEYIPEKRLLFIPTFFDNRVVAYRLGD